MPRGLPSIHGHHSLGGPKEGQTMTSHNVPHDLILRPTTFAPSAWHHDRPGVDYAIIKCGNSNYAVLWCPLGIGRCAQQPGDILFSNLADGAPDACPHCGDGTCPVLKKARDISDWVRFMKG